MLHKQTLNINWWLSLSEVNWFSMDSVNSHIFFYQKEKCLSNNFASVAIQSRITCYGTKGWINNDSIFIFLWSFKSITARYQSVVQIIITCPCCFCSDQLQSITVYPSVHLWMQLLLDALWRGLLAHTHCCGSFCWKTAFNVVLPSWVGWVFE